MTGAGTEGRPPVSLRELSESCGARIGPPGIEPQPAPLLDLTHDSRQVKPGWVYCCVPGASVDGHRFAPDAVSAGASALIVERYLDLDDSGGTGPVPQLLVEDARAAMGPVAAELHGHPSRSLNVVGVTGTNGKSSVVQLLADLFRHCGRATEIIGTVTGSRTTPEASDLQRLLAHAVATGVDTVAMEVSSHALSLHRVSGTRFAGAIFTNLGHDHLDFHNTVDAYFEAKSRLFLSGFTDLGVINRDDPHGRRLLESARPVLATTLDYGLGDVDQLTFDGPVSRFRWRGHEVQLPLAGAHNVSNALGAATMAVALGLKEADVVAGLSRTVPVRGRFEMLEGGQPFHVAVDYAHTPDALQSALTAARQVAGDNRVLLIFGCGGDRDIGKRPEMGQVAEKGADVLVITSDNPRSEDPMSIIDAIVKGLEQPSTAIVEPDRRTAINTGLDRAQPGDVVLIAGKGHETYQIIGDQTFEFDDRQVARDALGIRA